ncbi:hypothetical protein F8388_003060 [Cannabis sativa]|uniref:Transposase Tnp1/En/Spm-like domain-containing protein n=1 Tax=Cannabis sativa TaxID=3483 RepID=A0A7J6HE35_CANSA|nr:hypothetical protein F8388_003060 [Cannabis sativa]
MDDELLQTQRKSAKNKSSHAKNKYNHTTGRKNFAQLRALQKAGGASTPTRATMFKICYAKKKKSIINEKTKEVMTLDRGDIATSSNLVGETVNIKNVTNEPKTIAIVIVKVPIKPNELLIKLYGCIKTIHDAVGGSIAWPTTFMISCKSDTQLDDSMLSFNYYKS